MLTLWHIATTLCITINLTCAETLWLDIDLINSTVLPLVIVVWSNWSGPQTLSHSDWPEICGDPFLAQNTWYSFWMSTCPLSPALAAAFHPQSYCFIGYSCP